MAPSPDDSRLWSRVDEYLAGLLLDDDDVLAEARRASAAAGLPDISVTPLQGQLLMILAAACRASRILEIGTLGGYSTIWLARALGDLGRLITIESDRLHFDTASATIARAGLSDRVRLRLGPAVDVLRALAVESAGPFDLVFIDADKRQYAEYLGAVMPLVRSGALIIADNVVRKGAVADERGTDEKAEGIRRFLAAVRNEPRLIATVVQTVGAKGHDGWAVALVR